MPADLPEEKRVFLLPGTSAWRWLMWAALTAFLFNAWAVGWHKWPLLTYEVPSQAALAQGHWWTLLTYALTSAGLSTATQWGFGPLSVFFLFVVLQLVEAEMTRRDFLQLCAWCALAGSGLWQLLHWHGGEPLLAGCTVLVLGLLSFWCLAVPDEPLPLRLFLVVDLRPATFFWLVLALETGAFLSFELPKILGHPGAFNGDFDNSAHLGAMLAGAVFARWWKRAQCEVVGLPALETEAPPRRPVAIPVGVRRIIEAKTTAAANSTPPTFTSRRELREELDRILDKINHDGIGSLSPQERQTLDRAKNMLKK